MRAGLGYTYEFVTAEKATRVSMLDSSRRGVDFSFVGDVHANGFRAFTVTLGEGA
jgi:hypothetical protein